MKERLTAVLRVDDELLAVDSVSVGRVDVLVHTSRAGAAEQTSILCKSKGTIGLSEGLAELSLEGGDDLTDRTRSS